MNLLPKTALLLIAHGSREEDANADLRHVVGQLRELGRYDVVEASFLDLVQPDIMQAGARCVDQGAERVILLPYFLSAGVHVRRDLTEACRRLSENYPRVHFRLAEPLGPHPSLVKLLVERAQQAEAWPSE